MPQATEMEDVQDQQVHTVNPLATDSLKTREDDGFHKHAGKIKRRTSNLMSSNIQINTNTSLFVLEPTVTQYWWGMLQWKWFYMNYCIEHLEMGSYSLPKRMFGAVHVFFFEGMCIWKCVGEDDVVVCWSLFHLSTYTRRAKADLWLRNF